MRGGEGWLKMNKKKRSESFSSFSLSLTLTIVRVDLQRGRHAHREALLGGVQGFAGGVGAGVADDEDFVWWGVERKKMMKKKAFLF